MLHDSGVFFALSTFFAGLAVVRFAFASGEREASNSVSTNFDIPSEHTFWESRSKSYSFLFLRPPILAPIEIKVEFRIGAVVLRE
jgi:hypothetical protein